MQNKTKELSQNELEARALIAGDLFKDGKITRIETFRIEVDAALGKNTGDLKFENNNDYKNNMM